MNSSCCLHYYNAILDSNLVIESVKIFNAVLENQEILSEVNKYQPQIEISNKKFYLTQFVAEYTCIHIVSGLV